MSYWQIAVKWRVEADTSMEAFQKRRLGNEDRWRAMRLPWVFADVNSYDSLPDHRLHEVPVEVLAAARRCIHHAVEWGDVDPVMAHVLADSVVYAVLDPMRRWVTGCGSCAIGVVADLQSPLAPIMIQGIEEELQTFSGVLVGSHRSSPTREASVIESMVDRQMDGLILIAPTLSLDRLEELARRIPVVVIARHGGGQRFDTVVADDAAAATMMVDHLVDLGHRKIVHVAAAPMENLRRPSVGAPTARQDAYIQAMFARGLSPEVITTSDTERGGDLAARTALTRADPPTAILAGTDTLALGVLGAAYELGFKVPDDLTLTGVDNIVVGWLPQIALTTIDTYGYQAGSTGARLLRERIEGRRGHATTERLTPHLIVRGSSARPRRT
jgi:LacI family transcriptional regulator